MPRRSVPTFARICIRCVRKGSHQGKFLDVSEWIKAMLFGHGRGTETQELSMTCVTQAVQRLLLQLMTATYGFQLGGTLEATPPRWIMLSCSHRTLVSTQTVRNRLHDAKPHSRCPWRGPHLTPRHHAARYRWTQQHAEWTHQNWHQVLFTDGCCICLQPDNHRRRVWRKYGQAECLRHTIQRVHQGGGSLMFWALKRLYDTEWHPPTYTATILGEFREELVLMNDNSRPHRAHLVFEFLHDKNIARLEWPACSPDMNPIAHAWDTLKRAVFGRDDPTNHSERPTPILRWEMEQSGTTGPWWTSGQYATSNTGMHQRKRTCYWVLEVLIYAATCIFSNTESWNVVFV